MIYYTHPRTHARTRARKYLKKYCSYQNFYIFYIYFFIFYFNVNVRYYEKYIILNIDKKLFYIYKHLQHTTLFHILQYAVSSTNSTVCRYFFPNRAHKFSVTDSISIMYMMIRLVRCCQQTRRIL